ncbi:hypothetical protein Tco_0749939 [Tanacetum coccineum]|uniref:Reverse transcriptase domain-containing protein n=1 Tax=Tanacetum coccineum TaxID=301880 RepID=A0ABQ4YZU4_9ASTR
MRTPPTLSPGLSDRLTEAMDLSLSSFHKRYRSSYETPSSSSSPTSSPTLPLQKRYRGTSELIEDTETEGEKPKDEGTDSKSEEATSKDQHQQAVPAEDKIEDVPLGLRYGAARHRALEQVMDTAPSTSEDPKDGTIYRDIECDIPSVRSPVQTPPSPAGTPASPDWSLDPLSDSPLIPSPLATPVPAAALNEGDLLEIGSQLELHRRFNVSRSIDMSYPPVGYDVSTFPLRTTAFCSKRRLFKTPGLVESISLELDLFSDVEEHLKEEITGIVMETMEQYMIKTHGNYGSRVVRPKINDKTHFELKGQYLKKLHENTFSGSKHKDANEHIEKLLEIVDLFHIPEVTQDQEVILFYNGLDVPTRQILDSKGAIPTKTAIDAKIAIQEMAEFS